VLRFGLRTRTNKLAEVWLRTALASPTLPVRVVAPKTLGVKHRRAAKTSEAENLGINFVTNFSSSISIQTIRGEG